MYQSTPPASQNTSIASIFAPESQKTLFFSKIRQSHRHNSTLRWTQTLQSRQHKVQYICWKYFSPFAEILSRCGEIRSDRSLLGTRSAENHKKSMVFIEFLDDATRSSQTEIHSRSKCIEASAANFIAPEHAWATNGEGANFSLRTQKQPYYFFVLFFFLHNITKLNLNSVQFNLV